MKQKTAFLFGIHMHQPVDNFAWVIEKAVTTCYGPFFEIAERYPAFKFSVHCSGWLLEQIRDGYPELFARMQRLAHQGTIELFGAGFYEPILSSIPSPDRRSQIDLLSDTKESYFGKRPKGVWLTERVWEASLIPDLYASGIRYTVMDDYHFLCTGFDEARLDGYYMTEESGMPMGLFPISKKLRYAIPFLSVEKSIETIKSYARENDSVAILFDDAEKFGMWPNTHKWVYEKGWLASFIEAVLSDEQIEPMHFGSYFANHRPRGIAYLPNVSYYEMGEWSLGADDALSLELLIKEMEFDYFESKGVKFIKGGIWKNFLVKYAESNRIHKRMLELSLLKSQINNEIFTQNLYRLQTNDVLWHGVFGGLYLPNLRDNAYRYLIACETIRHQGINSITEHNPEMDPYPKALVATDAHILRFDAQNGGQLIEFDCKQSGFNWQNTLTRRKEAYHQKILQAHHNPQTPQTHESDGIDTIHTVNHRVEQEVRDALVYDWYLKHSFIDHISDASFSLENFKQCRFREFGDFANQPFEMTIESDRLYFERNGGIYLSEKYPTTMQKLFIPTKDGFEFEITLQSECDTLFNYALELNLHFADYQAVTINDAPLKEGTLVSINQFRLFDAYTQKTIVFTSDTRFTLHYASLLSVSQSEEGYELTIQAFSFALLFPFERQLKLFGDIKVENV